MQSAETITETAIAPTSVLDAQGLNCPLPILRAKKALNALSSGDVLRVLATDPGATADFSAFCKQTGNAIVSSSTANGVLQFDIQKG